MPSRSGMLLFLVLTFLLFSEPMQPVLAQQVTPPKFKAQAELVLVHAVVRNNSGHVPNLKKEDFTVLDNGRPREITVLEEVRQGRGRVETQSTPGIFTNTLKGARERNNLAIIALDTVTTPVLRQTQVRKQLLSYLAQAVQGDTMVGLVLLRGDGVHVIHDFTADPKILAQALRQLPAVLGGPIEHVNTKSDQDAFSSRAGGGPGVAQDSNAEAMFSLNTWAGSWVRGQFETKVDDIDLKQGIFAVLNGIEQIAQSVAGLPGRKSLIWIGGGFPFSLSGGAVGQDPSIEIMGIGVVPSPSTLINSEVSEMIGRYDHVWKVLNGAGVALYGIDIRPFSNPDVAGAEMAHRSATETRQNRWLGWDIQSTFASFANATGGQAYYQVYDVGKAYKDAMDDSSAYYVIGYYLDRKKDQPGWHDISVKVRAAGASVRARRGYLVRPAEDKPTRERDIQVAMLSPSDYTGLPLSGVWQKVSGTGAKRRAAFELRVPPGVALVDESNGNQLDLDIYAAARDAQGKQVATVSQKLEGKLSAATVAQIKQVGVVYDNKLELPPGEYQVRFVVRDNTTARIGTVTSSLKVE